MLPYMVCSTHGKVTVLTLAILPICTQIKKNHFGHSFAFDAPTLWNDLPDDVRSAPTLACFRKKITSYLFDKAFSPLYLNFPVSLWCRPGYISVILIIELDLVSRLRVCLGRD